MKYLLEVAIVCGIFLLSVCEGAVTLTTAKVVAEDIPKPTTLHLRRSNIGLLKDTPEDSLNLLDSVLQPERRSNSEVLWKWDYWCQMQTKTGECTEPGRTKLHRYYYNAQLDQCLSFEYSGCDGNKNNFESTEDCERRCKGSIFMPYKEVERKGSCALQPHSGVCLGLQYRYYYDINSESCKRFTYGGCGGNQNRFHTSLDCLEWCMSSGETEDSSPLRSGVIENSTETYGAIERSYYTPPGNGITRLNDYDY